MMNDNETHSWCDLRKRDNIRTVLFCSDTQATEELPTIEAEIIRAFVQAGIKVHVMSMSGKHYRVGFQESHKDQVTFEPIQTGSKVQTDVRRFAWEVAQRTATLDADIVFACGLTLCRTLVGNATVSRRLWCMLRRPELTFHLEKGLDGHPYLESIASGCIGVVVQDSEVREKLKLAVSSKSMHSTFVLNAINVADSKNNMSRINIEQLLHMSFSPYRVLIYCDQSAANALLKEEENFTIKDAVSAASELVHVYVLCEGPEHICDPLNLASNNRVTLVELAASPRQLEGSRVLPRYVTWHLLNAFQKFKCDILITAATEVSYEVAKNKHLGPKLWALIDARDLRRITSAAFGQIERVVRRSAMVVVKSEEERSRLELAISSSTSKTVVLEHGTGQCQLDSTVNCAGLTPNAAFSCLIPRYVGPQGRPVSQLPKEKVLFIGHDFKFIGELVDLILRQPAYSIEMERSNHQNEVDHETAISKMHSSDVVFCEFASGNAVWCSENKRPHQKLVIRFHGYELYTENVRKIVVSEVDMFVFVSDFYLQKARSELGWPASKCCVIPNMIDVLDLNREKLPGVEYQLGMAGVVPSLKRPDLALDLLENLLEIDDRYTLRIRGRFPWEYPWVWRDGSERRYYENIYRRISASSLLRRHVVFEEFGPDMGRWLRKVGWMLSPSDRETFHLAPIEGAAALSIPVVWEREGAQEIFNRDWIHENTSQAATYISALNSSANGYAVQSTIAGRFAKSFDISSIDQSWLNLFSSSAESRSYNGNPSVKAAIV